MYCGIKCVRDRVCVCVCVCVYMCVCRYMYVYMYVYPTRPLAVRWFRGCDVNIQIWPLLLPPPRGLQLRTLVPATLLFSLLGRFYTLPFFITFLSFFLGHLWTTFAPQNGPQINQKTMQSCFHPALPKAPHSWHTFTRPWPPKVTPARYPKNVFAWFSFVIM